MKALIFGAGGQDGSYLADILLERNYEVHAFVRRSSVNNLARIEHILPHITLHRGDLLDCGSVRRALQRVQPDEIYNEADQDNVGWSHAAPSYSYDVTFAAVGRLFEAVLDICPQARVFQPVSATMFEGSPPPQNEDSLISPMSPYACAKSGTYLLAQYYRTCRKLFVATGILFNHDSPRRGPDYLLSKICQDTIKVASGKLSGLLLGNLDSLVDIGYAREYMVAAANTLQLASPEDFVIASGKTHTIRDIGRAALNSVGAEVQVVENPDYTRPCNPLIGNISKARKLLGYNPQYDSIRLVREMIQGSMT